MAVSGIIGALVDDGLSTFWDVVTSTPVATIASPPGLTVPHKVQLYGTYRDVPAEQDIWAVTQTLDSNRFYPQDKPCIAFQGRFNCGDFYIGKAPGEPGAAGPSYFILILRATDEAVNEFYRYQFEKQEDENPGLGMLPRGAEIIADKQIVRS